MSLLLFGVLHSWGGPTQSLAASPSGNPLWAIPLAALSATHERPLFSPSRRPPKPPIVTVPPVQAVAARPPAEPDTPLFTLVGTVISNRGAIAIVQNPPKNDTTFLRLGEEYGGWRLRLVHPRDISLEKGTLTATLSLPQFGLQQTQAATPQVIDLHQAALFERRGH